MSTPQALKRVVINGNRFYQSANDPTKLYPSVTTILSSALPKPGLSVWQRRFSVDSFKRKILSSASTYHTPDMGDLKILPNDNILQVIADQAVDAPDSIRDISASFGTQAHTLIEDLIKSGLDDISCSAELEPTKRAFIAWRKESLASGSKIIEIEREVWSDEYGYAGTMDAVLETIDSRTGLRSLAVLDWKTSNSMRNEYALQVAAYAKAYEERTAQKVSKAIVVRFAKRSDSYEAKTVLDLDKSFDAFCSALHLYHSLSKPLL